MPAERFIRDRARVSHTHDEDDPMRRFRGKNRDSIYELLVSDAGLYGKAFFGHKKSSAESKKLKRLWDRAAKIFDGMQPVEVAPTE